MNHPISRATGPMVSRFMLDRRAHKRYAMVNREGFLHADGEKVPCMVRNISSGGLLARIYQSTELSGSIGIELADGHLLRGTVLWARGWEVGVAFTGPIDVEAVLAEQWVTEGGKDRRSNHRVSIQCPVTLQIRRRFYYGKLCDVSPTGAGVRTPGIVKGAKEAILSLPGLPPLSAAIRWTNGSDCGLSFREQIPAAALAAWLEERNWAPPGSAK